MSEWILVFLAGAAAGYLVGLALSVELRHVDDREEEPEDRDLPPWRRDR